MTTYNKDQITKFPHGGFSKSGQAIHMMEAEGSSGTVASASSHISEKNKMAICLHDN